MSHRFRSDRSCHISNIYPSGVFCKSHNAHLNDDNPPHYSVDKQIRGSSRVVSDPMMSDAFEACLQGETMAGEQRQNHQNRQKKGTMKRAAQSWVFGNQRASPTLSARTARAQRATRTTATGNPALAQCGDAWRRKTNHVTHNCGVAFQGNRPSSDGHPSVLEQLSARIQEEPVA